MSRTSALFTLASILLATPLSLYAQGYGGPSLLSRGGNSPGRRGRAPADFRVYAAVRGSYETGLIAPLLEDGTLPSTTVKGTQVEAGAYGAKTFKSFSIGLDYRGDYRRTNRRQYDGSNQALSFDLQGQRGRRLIYFARQTGGTTNRAFGGFSAPSFADQDNFGVPLNEVFDSRVYFSQTSGGLGYVKSARTILRFSGDGFIVKRSSRALIGMQGYRAGLDAQKRISRSTTLGAGYNYIRFTYPRAFGGSEIHMLLTKIERRLNRNWDASAQIGAFRAETTGTQQITLSPEVAAILGRTTGVEAFRRVMYAPQISAGVTYTLERSRFNGAISTGVNPGNGIYLTSRADSVRGGYSYSGIRRLALGVSAGYSRTRSIGIDLQNLSNVQGGGGLTYSIAPSWSFTLQVDRRDFSAPGVTGRSGISAVAGISFSPGNLPLSIW